MSEPATVTPLLRGLARRVEKADRSGLIEIHKQSRALRNEWLRKLIVEHNRIDLLASEILGIEVLPFHLALFKWQFAHPSNLQLVFRGAGKTTTCTVAKAIHLLAKNRNLRIGIASKAKGNSQAFLKEIKGHLEHNERLIEVFGEFYDPRRVAKWDDSEIEVVGRTKHAKEASITCLGVDSAIVSKHFDVLISDDLVDEENSRTKHMRDKIKVWNYQTLDPTLEPPDPDVPHRGEHHRHGTRYHFDDLYGHWIENELRGHVQVIPALDERGRSPWPKKYPPRWFQEKKKHSGTIIFNAQYQCDTEAMKGEIFRYDDCQIIDDELIPKDLKIFQGVDLAITEEEKNDQFANVTIGVTGKLGTDDVMIYVLDYFAGYLRFSEQTRRTLELYRKHKPLRGCIESNAYQLAQWQTLDEKLPGIRLVPVQTDKDKITRAWKLSPLFEARRVFFRRSMGPLIDQLVLFPNYKHKDLFDALDLAVRASKLKDRRKRRRTRAREPGLM